MWRVGTDCTFFDPCAWSVEPRAHQTAKVQIGAPGQSEGEVSARNKPSILIDAIHEHKHFRRRGILGNGAYSPMLGGKFLRSLLLGVKERWSRDGLMQPTWRAFSLSSFVIQVAVQCLRQRAVGLRS